MEYFPVRYDSRVVNYDRRGFIRLATGLVVMVGDSCPEGQWFKSQHHILDGHKIILYRLRPMWPDVRIWSCPKLAKAVFSYKWCFLKSQKVAIWLGYFHQKIYHQDLSIATSVTSKKLPNVHKSYEKMISLTKWKILTTLQKLPKIVGNLGKIIFAKGFESGQKCNKSPNLVTLN